MTVDEFEQYKVVANKVLNLLIQEKCSSIKDVNILYNVIRAYPYCLDTEGHYTYKGKYYNCLEELPKDGLEQLLCISEH